VRRDLPAGLCRAIDAAVLPEPEQRPILVALRGALARALDAVADDPGPIATQDGVAKTARMRPDRTRRHGAAHDPAAEPPTRARRHDFEAPAFEQAPGIRARRLRGRPPTPAGAPDVRASQWRAGEARPRHPDELEATARRRPARWPERAAAAAAAAALTAAALAWLGPEPPVSAAAGSLVAGAVVLLLPRLGWLAMVATLLAWLAVTAAGVALLLVIAAGPVPLLLARRGAAWSLPAVAPALGLLGVAGAWPALAGQARGWPTRAALGALGGLWLVLAEALTSDRLLFGQPREVLALGAWDSSAVGAARDALVPIWSGGTLAIAVLWALAAALLPVLVRGRSAALDLVAAAGWAAALAAATLTLSEALLLDPPRGAVLGAVAGGAFAIGARAARGRA